MSIRTLQFLMEWIGGHNSSAEVTIQDVVKDINIYRDLAGGVTVSQLLHGSANPIGDVPQL
jgi:hypothetical protein